MSLVTYGNQLFTGEVSANVTPKPTINTVSKIEFLKNAAGSYDQTVNGSTTPVDFYYEASSTVYVVSIYLLFDDGNNCYPDKYGKENLLTNGVQLIVKKNNTEYLVSNMKNNIEVVMTFNEPTIIGENQFLKLLGGMFSKLSFSVPVILNSSDRIIMRIRDDIRAINWQIAAIELWYEI